MVLSEVPRTQNWVFGWLPMCPLQSNKVNPLFSSFSFLPFFCSIKRYLMKSNTFSPIWSVVTPENNTVIRHFRWASCWSQRPQKNSWNDVTNRTRPRPNLIVFSLGKVSNMGVFLPTLKTHTKSKFQPNEKKSCPVRYKDLFRAKNFSGVLGT